MPDKAHIYVMGATGSYDSNYEIVTVSATAGTTYTVASQYGQFNKEVSGQFAFDKATNSSGTTITSFTV